MTSATRCRGAHRQNQWPPPCQPATGWSATSSDAPFPGETSCRKRCHFHFDWKRKCLGPHPQADAPLDINRLRPRMGLEIGTSLHRPQECFLERLPPQLLENLLDVH